MTMMERAESCACCCTSIQDGRFAAKQATGTETLQKCIELKPDVVVKDWVMPGMDSIELTRQISTLSPDTAIVIFSFYICLN
jgi:DNA-binding NarL/FixJ family response regulator